MKGTIFGLNLAILIQNMVILRLHLVSKAINSHVLKQNSQKKGATNIQFLKLSLMEVQEQAGAGRCQAQVQLV